jgi:hypothetical protein
MSRQLKLPESRYTAMVANWLKAERGLDEQARSDFRHFDDWCRFNGLRMPASAYAVADYLLDMLENGAPLADIERVATSIDAIYEHRGCPLDRRPIKAALAMAAAQLSPNRVLN